MQTADLPGAFVLPMPDDALSPSIARGTRLIFERGGHAVPGVGVLVQTPDGRRYVRRFVEAPGGAWLAQAPNPSYATLHSTQDQLRVLAVMTGRLDGSV
jgi:SOS-response transcriptional repressor LexA